MHTMINAKNLFILLGLLGLIACSTTSEKRFFLQYLKSNDPVASKIIRSTIPYPMEFNFTKMDINADGYKDFFAIPKDFNYFCTPDSCPLYIFIYQPIEKTWKFAPIAPSSEVTFKKVLLLKTAHHQMQNIALLDFKGNQTIFCWNQNMYKTCYSTEYDHRFKHP